MRIATERGGGFARLTVEGRLDREGAERLSDTLEDLLHHGVRSVRLDFAGVSYASTALARVLSRWHRELALLRGDVKLESLPPAVQQVLAAAGWDDGRPPALEIGLATADRRSYWHARSDFAASGSYELSAAAGGAVLDCRLLGDPGLLAREGVGADDLRATVLPEEGFGVGLGAIGDEGDARHRLGELISVAGCVAYFPSDGAHKPDYLVGTSVIPPSASLATGLVCQGGFSQMLRFSALPEAGAVPLSELANVALDAAGGRAAGVVIVGETAGLCGARVRRSPAAMSGPLRFELPALREWLTFAPERTHPVTTAVIVGVVTGAAPGPASAHVRPLGPTGRLHGHFHAAVFAYQPLPQRTVSPGDLVRGLFADRALLDVLHLLWDDRPRDAVPESALVRGVGWLAPIAPLD